MSKLHNSSTYNTLNITSPKTKVDNLNNKENINTNINLKKKKSINTISKKEDPNKVKTPKEILSLLLKNTLGKSLFKLEKRTKEQSSTLKEIGKYYIFFEKKILSMKKGVEKKRKEEEKKLKMTKKLKITSTPSRIRSRTVQTLRRNTANQDKNINSINRTNKNNSKIKTLFRKKTSGNLNLENTPKIRSRTVKPSRYNTNNNIARVKNTKDSINTPKRVKEEEKEKEKLSHTLKRKDSIKLNIIRKSTNHKNKDEDKGEEKAGRKSIHRISKKNNSSKKNIKSEEGSNKNNIKITTNINTIKNSGINSPNKNQVKLVSDFSKDNNKINTDLNLNLNDSIKNININEILNDKKEEEKEQNKIKKNVLLKELEEYNDKKPRIEESKNMEMKRTRSRSRSKNKDEDINEIKELEGSLNDMKITLEGLNILKRPENKKIKFEKKKKTEKEITREEMVNKEINDLLESDNKEKGNVIKSKIINTDNNNNFIKNINIGKESQIMNEEIINTIENDKNILNSSILENNIKILNKDLEKNELVDSIINNKSEKENLTKSINNEVVMAEKEKEKDINNNDKEKKPKEKDINNNNINNNDKEKKSNEKINEEKKEIIQSGQEIMHDEQLVDPNKSSLLSQSSIMNQSAILAEQYVLITRNEDEPFSIENTLKFEKSQILTILDFLNFQEKIQFTGINRGFNIERIYILNDKREELITSLDLNSDETIDDLIMKTKLKYSNDELNKKFSEFQISRGAVKAVELLNNPLYSKLFKKPVLEKNVEEICKVYRTLFTLLGEYQIANIPEDEYFWVKCTEYLNSKSEGKIGSFILEKFKNVTFEKKKIVLINKFLVGMKKKINPNYFPKICGTTGLLIFLIKDALEYCGVIINDKKTQPARILDNLMYYKNSIETLAQIIEYLSGVKTYKIREKKINDN